MSTNKTLDIICIGRAAVDLYSQQIGARLEDVTSFAKYLGGSAGNIAYGCARLGLKSAMLTRVGDEHMGRFVRAELAEAKVDVSHVITDKKRLTGLAILAIKEKSVFPLVFYRTDCADMALSSDDFDAKFISSSKAILITGTHLSTTSTYATSIKAIEHAMAANTKVVLDIDYRPVLWGLTDAGDGETRFVESSNVTKHLQSIIKYCDVVVGTEEEIHIAGGSTDTITALKNIRSIARAVIVLKLGALGCTILEKKIPNSANDFIVVRGKKIEILNVLGAGDAFMAGFMCGYLNNESHETSANYANACGALVVSRHGCAPATPTKVELLYYLKNEQNIANINTDSELNYIHFTTTRHAKHLQQLCILAFDHRKQFYDLAKQYSGNIVQIKKLKLLLTEAVSVGIANTGLDKAAAGVLIDDTYGQDALNLVTGTGLWIARPVELPSSIPLELEGGRSIGTRLQTWPLEHIVKCLVFYSSNDEINLRLKQERQLKELFLACRSSGHQLLLEIIPPKSHGNDENDIIHSLRRLYNLGIKPDWWKLPPLQDATWQALELNIAKYDPYCKGVLVLGLAATLEEMQAHFAVAAKYDICKGFAIGRTLFYAPAERWFKAEIDDNEFITAVANNYAILVQTWQTLQANKAGDNK